MHSVWYIGVNKNQGDPFNNLLSFTYCNLQSFIYFESNPNKQHLDPVFVSQHICNLE